MSNIKISNLPLIPSVSPDDVLPIVDSGFTTTYKVKVSSLQGTSGTSGSSGSSGTSGSSGLGFTWQGGWQSITTYFINDVVYYSGASYVALGTIAAGGNPPDINASWENMNAQGQAGTNGTSGSSGSSGTSGISGTSGSSGSSGSSGTSGVSGTSGSSGSSGSSGTSGVSGTSGSSGSSGSSGTSGVNGTSGSSGSSGTSGTSGQSNNVYSGGTLVVSGATILNFSGATITSGGTGQANITITAEGGLVNGSGSSSLKQKDGLTTTPATASGQNSIAIGNGAQATQLNGVAIGKGANVVDGSYGIHISNGNVGSAVNNGSIWVGGGNMFGGTNNIHLGVSGYINATNAISMGWETAVQGNGSISIGGSALGPANRANANYSTTIGQSSAANNSIYGVILGTRCANTYYLSEGNNIIGSYLSENYSSGGYNSIFGGKSNTITGTTSGSTLVGCIGKTPTRDNATFVENLVVFNYAGLDYANDAAAASGGVVLGQVYHTAGILKIRVV